jgi:hypothetical protein
MVALLYTEGIMCGWIVASVKGFGSVPQRVESGVPVMGMTSSRITTSVASFPDKDPRIPVSELHQIASSLTLPFASFC